MSLKVKNIEVIERPKGLGHRHGQFVLYSIGTVINMAIKSNLSVAIVAMTDESTNSKFQTFDWDEPTKGLLLSSVFWGYVVSQTPGGYIAHLFGAKKIFLLTVLLSSILTGFTPLLAPLGWEYVCVLRVLIGLTQGFGLPCVHALMARWIHPSERGLSAIVMAANAFGTFGIMAISGVIAESNIGWPGIFYLSTVIGIVWSVFWVFFGSETPSNHKKISVEERAYLLNSSHVNSSEKLKLPWAQIFTSLPFLSIFFANIGEIWGYFTLMTETPAYMAKTLDFNIKSSAIWSGIPYLCKSVSSVVLSITSDFLINKQYLSRGASRKLFSSIGTWIPAACMIALGFVTKDNGSIGIALFALSFTFNAASYVGFMINHMDIAPNFAGTLFGITNGVSNIFSILGPIFVGFIVTDQTDHTQWRIVFLVTAGFYFIGNLIFIIFSKGTVQSWNEGRQRRI